MGIQSKQRQRMADNRQSQRVEDIVGYELHMLLIITHNPTVYYPPFVGAEHPIQYYITERARYNN